MDAVADLDLDATRDDLAAGLAADLAKGLAFLAATLPLLGLALRGLDGALRLGVADGVDADLADADGLADDAGPLSRTGFSPQMSSRW